MLSARMLCAVVAVVACAFSAGTANAATYQFKNAAGTAVKADPSGRFAENISIVSLPDDPESAGDERITLDPEGPGVPAGVKNVCDAVLAGHITANATSDYIRASMPGHVFYGCNLNAVYAAGTWKVWFAQNKVNPFPGKIGGVDVLLENVLGSGQNCEFRGTPTVSWQLGGNVMDPSDDVLKLGGKVTQYPSGSPGSLSTPGCPITEGLVSGKVRIDHNSTPGAGGAQGITIG